MSQSLPQLPKPEFVLITIEAPPEVPTRIAVDLRETGIPGGLIGYEYRPLSKLVYFGTIGERGLVAIATSGLFGRIAVDVASGRVVQIPNIESSTTHHVNRDLDSFNRCIAAVIARFPFYAEGDEEMCEEAAEELRELISGVDGTALAHEGFWETFCDDVAIGDYADWDAHPPR
ncbi:SUKH-4 family immunity protein [Streptomyces olivochromogenes]|uniref:SUKH-4 family immunity protein n=1 Tax=Streptomyces olivochromogenes TaxID=1963 RepID=UPI001F27B02A|nr:SUKH-4 family immunity protein [Streptomyces olivochromogenes]MCF3132249.1 SUKH-4 family immunity protein [Streptomyces olivochromogenes]